MSKRQLLMTLLAAAITVGACAPRSTDVNTPQGPGGLYPPKITSTAASRRDAEDAWRLLLAEFRLPEVGVDLEPVIFTPRSLPPEISRRIRLEAPEGPLDPTEAKQALRRFIEHVLPVLIAGARDRQLTLKDISLASFQIDGELYRATYRQMNYPYHIDHGYGEARFTITRTGELVQLESYFLPAIDFPARPAIDPATLPDKLVGRELTYSAIDGRPLTSRVNGRDEVVVKDPVIYPRLEGEQLWLHLAYPVEVGRGMTWTIYIDAVNGSEIEVKQNFNT
jgi:hypothetical protein